MNDLNDDQQKLAGELVSLVMQRVYTKLAPDLTEEDIKKLEELDSKDETGSLAKEFLVSKFPNFDRMFEQEVESLKTQIAPSNP